MNESFALPPPRRKKTGYLRHWLKAFAILLLAVCTVGLVELDIHWPFRYHIVAPFLEKVLASQIKIDRYHRTYLPHPGFVAEGLTLRRNSAPDLPPLGTADRLMVQGRWIDLLFFRNRLQFVRIDGLHLVIPPASSRANHEDFPPGSSSDFAGPTTLLDHLILRNAILDLEKKEGPMLRFPIRDLTIGDLQKGRTVSYRIDMDSPVPRGHILASGTFGPLNPKSLGSTPLFGEFTFAPILLGSIGGLAGTLSAQGSFQGTIQNIEATGKATTSNFAVGHGRPTAIVTRAQFSVNGLNANIHIHSLDATLGATLVHAEGSVLGTPKVTNLDLAIVGGRVQDVLHPFLTHSAPVTGPLWLHSHAYVSPAAPGVSFLQRLYMNGTLDIPSERITSAKTEQSLTTFTRRIDAHPLHPDPRAAAQAEAEADVLSTVRGPVTLRNAVASTAHLVFEVPGASATLAGTYNLRNLNVHLIGNLHMNSDLSHVTTGFKSFLLIPLNPFFKRDHGPTVLPIAVTGGPGNYKVQQDIFHNK